MVTHRLAVQHRNRFRAKVSARCRDVGNGEQKTSVNLGALEATVREQAVSCWILFCHLSLDIIEAVSAGRQQKAAGKEAHF